MDYRIEFHQSEKRLIEKWRRTLTHEVALPVLINQDPRSAHLRSFGDLFSREAPEVKVILDHDDGVDLPAIIPHESIKFHGVPLGTELSPFLALIAGGIDAKGDFSDAMHRRLDRIFLPAAFKLYIMPQCPYCPKMVHRLTSLARVCELIDLAIVDGALFKDQADKDRIRSAPTLLLEDQFRWSGLTDLSEIIDAAINRDSLHLGISSLKKMLTQGRAQELAGMMLAEEALFPAFIELLVDSKWPVRLGAMVALEYLADGSPILSKAVIPPLMERFDYLTDTVKGDILYVFGLFGDYRLLPALKAVLENSQDASVVEAAQEALDAIQSRSR